MVLSVFDYICKRVAWADYITNVSSVEIAKHLNISLYKSRKYIKELVDLGFLKSDIQVLYIPPLTKDDDYYPPRIYRGYTLTEKGIETNTYKKHYQECMKSYEDWAKGMVVDDK